MCDLHDLYEDFIKYGTVAYTVFENGGEVQYTKVKLKKEEVDDEKQNISN